MMIFPDYSLKRGKVHTKMKLKLLDSFEEEISPPSLLSFVNGFHEELKQKQNISTKKYYNGTHHLLKDSKKEEGNEQKIDDILINDMLLIKDDSEIGLVNLLKQQEKIQNEKGVSFNIMVCGSVGVGKTTLIKNLFGLDRPYTVLKSSHSKDVLNIEQHKIEIYQSNVKLNLGIVEINNFGNKIDNSMSWIPVNKFIDEQVESYIFQEEQPYRKEKFDNRIHCCIYIIEPINDTVIRPLDIITMKELGQRVNLIPVVTKADIIDPDEFPVVQDNMRTILKVQNIQVCKFLDNENCEMINKLVPFYVGNSQIIEKPTIDQTPQLQKVIIDFHLNNLIDSTELYYERKRTEINEMRLLYCKSLEKTKGEGKNYADIHIISKCRREQLGKMLTEWTPEYISKQYQLKNKYNQLLRSHELKFQEWTKELVENQAKYNEDIESCYRSLESLRNECQALEYKLITAQKMAIGYMADSKSHTNISSRTLVDGALEENSQSKGKRRDSDK